MPSDVERRSGAATRARRDCRRRRRCAPSRRRSDWRPPRAALQPAADAGPRTDRAQSAVRGSSGCQFQWYSAFGFAPSAQQPRWRSRRVRRRAPDRLCACTCGRRRAAAPSPAGRPGAVASSGCSREPRLDRSGVAEHERRLQRGRRDARMQREQPLGAARRAAGRAADELVDRRVERQRARLDFFAQRVPRREAVLARDRPTARRAARDRRRAISSSGLPASAGRIAKRCSASGSRACAASSSDFACFFSCSRFGRAGSSRSAYDLHASALWFADRRHGGFCRWSSSDDGGLGPSREPAGALYARPITIVPWLRRVSNEPH